VGGKATEVQNRGSLDSVDVPRRLEIKGTKSCGGEKYQGRDRKEGRHLPNS